MNIKPISSAHTVGTGFHGTSISASVAELTAAFGPASYQDNTGADKVNYEWCLQLDGEPFTIYDWKEYRPIHPTETIEWHIGGKSQAQTGKACQAIADALENKPAATNPYVDMSYIDRTDEIEARFQPTVDDMKRDPELYAELVNDLLYHWIHGTRETLIMNMFKQDILNPKSK
jgi:hypothetical protein